MHSIGIDVSKKKLDVCMIVDTETGKRKSKVIANDASAINTFLA
jgi:transposase